MVLLFFVCLWFRDDLPKFLDHTCPCTLLLFIAYAIVRTEPSATSAKPEKKKYVDIPIVDAAEQQTDAGFSCSAIAVGGCSLLAS